MKYEIKMISTENNHQTIDEYELSKFYFNEIIDYLSLLEEHKKMLKGGKK